MAIYDAVKDLLKTAQKADNIELYRQLLDLGQQAQNLQDEIAKLKDENEKLKKNNELGLKIVRHKGVYVTLKDDDQQIIYCAHCWDNEKKLIQVKILDYGEFFCPHCRIKDRRDESKYITTTYL